MKTLHPDALALLAAAGLDPTLRAENLSVAEFASLARAWTGMRG